MNPSGTNRRALLDRTARSFAVSVRLLPPALRGPVELAYLLARAADTLADRSWAGGSDPGGRLAAFRAALGGAGAAPSPAHPPPPDPTSEGEAALLRDLPSLIDELRNLPDGDREDVAAVVDTLAATMEDEVRAFPAAGRLSALPDAAALTRYTEGIAGCVGLFWTRLAVRHAGLHPARAVALGRAGRRYGRGLQLVNVLRDLPRDLRRGRCLLPRSDLAAAGLRPEDLLDPASAGRAAPVFQRWEGRARAGLVTGLVYSARLPSRAWRVRVATALPARLGLDTLALLGGEQGRLDPARVIKVSRADLARALRSTAFWCAFPRGPLRLAR